MKKPYLETLNIGNAKQDENLVKAQFEEQAHLYSKFSYFSKEDSHIVPFLAKWMRENQNQLQNRTYARICEFGGGGGHLLNEIYKRLGNKAELYNAELVEKYRHFQTLDKINFVYTSVLAPQFCDNHFDAVIIRNILHHLIGESLEKTRVNQCKAIGELFRVVKPGGVVLISEQVNRYSFACVLLYLLSRLASRIKLRIEIFQITPYTVVGYLTRKQLIRLCEKFAPSTNWLVNVHKPWSMPLRWKLTLLAGNTGEAFIAIQKPC